MKKKIACVLLMLLVLIAALALWLVPSGYASQDREAIDAQATHEHWTGTDSLGRDRTVRVAAALLIGLVGAGVAAATSTSIAAGFGLIAAFSHPAVAGVFMFISDAFLSLPWLFLLMMARAMLPLTASPAQTAILTFLCLAALGWPACARAIFRGAIELRSAEWLIQGRASGLRTWQLVRIHLFPHLLPLLLPQFLISIPVFIVAEANLGALGLGIGEPLPSWGTMLLELDNSALIARSPWVFLPIVLLVVVLFLIESLTSQEEANV
jgi:ABC-type dipeptide/oligopeptide/nickel transport system permease subunit